MGDGRPPPTNPLPEETASVGLVNGLTLTATVTYA